MSYRAILFDVGGPIDMEFAWGIAVDSAIASGCGLEVRVVDGKAVKAPAPGLSPPADLADRLVLALLNECVACLREGVVEDADLLDAGVIFGTGFAPFRGGPLQYARQRGIAAVVARLRELQARHGTRFTPDPGWDRLA